MKNPQEPLGASRKTLPTNKARSATKRTKPKAKNPLDRDVERDLVKTFGER